jgi:hypothetical protein
MFIKTNQLMMYKEKVAVVVEIWFAVSGRRKFYNQQLGPQHRSPLPLLPGGKYNPHPSSHGRTPYHTAEPRRT